MMRQSIATGFFAMATIKRVAGVTDNTASGPPGLVAATVTAPRIDENSGSFERVARWRPLAGRGSVARRVTLVLMGLAVLAGIATFLVLTGSVGLGITQDTLLALLMVDLVLVLCLGAMVVFGLVRLWAERRAGAVGARLHLRLVALFALVAVAPAILVAVLAALFFNFEVKTWFNDRVRAAVNNSVAVAEAYLQEHKQVIAADALAMANDLNRAWPALISSSERVHRLVENQAALRALSEAILFDTGGRVLARGGLTVSLEYDRPPPWAIERAAGGEVVILTSGTDDRVRALVGLNTVPQAFLYVGRFVDPNVLRHLELTRQASFEYNRLEDLRTDLQLTMAGVFVAFALLILLTAVGVGLGFANRLARRVSRLVAAAEQVRAGNLAIRLEETGSDDELGSLMRSFNRMTRQIGEQHGELVEANRQLEERRRFTEVVLAGVSAGVMGLDGAGRVNLPNRSAAALLALQPAALIGKPLVETVPEMGDLVAAALRQPARLNEGQIIIARGDSRRTLHVRIVAEQSADGTVVGFVVTFDDVTELLAAQRKAAWADIARRIAHEIKNPLTPIQLSAERLKRKYAGQIAIDRDTFEQCTETIVRHVGDIGRMVDEFSSFARMPAPVMETVDVAAICRDSVLLQQTAHPAIEFELAIGAESIECQCDATLVSQALTNLLQNAVDAIGGRLAAPAAQPGCVDVAVTLADEDVAIAVTDNGRGLPAENREALAEPYVTTRSHGTGLGLAIVKKIMEDHGGQLVLEDRPPDGETTTLAGARGARVSLVFPAHIAARFDDRAGGVDTRSAAE